jgi:sigma-B regulation protein RsbU (phosphoserine phosphatase)
MSENTARSIEPEGSEAGSQTNSGVTSDVPTGSIAGTGTATATGTGIHSTTGLHTATIVAPGMADAPKLDHVSGMKLEQVLLLTTGAMIVAIVALLAGAFAFSTSQQFAQTGSVYEHRLQDQAKELGQTVAKTLSLTTRNNLRDNDYGTVNDVVHALVKDNPNVLRVQVFNAEGGMVADSDPDAKEGTPSGRQVASGANNGIYRSKPVIEYQEPIDYGSAQKALVVVSYSLEPLQQQKRELDQTKAAALASNTTRAAVLGLGFVLVASIISFFQSRRLTRPLGTLNDSVNQLASGNLEARVPAISGAREVKTLGIVFNHMADRIGYLLEDARTKAQLEREMALARTVQETLLPRREPMQVGPLRIAGACITADACGGDWWLRAQLDDRRAVLGIGDVTGHGLSTALVATSATSGFAAAIKMREPDQINAAMLASSLNQTLFHVGRGEYQMSSALAMFDLQTGEVEYAAGAHPSAAVVNRVDGQAGSLLARGPLLGAAPDSKYSARKQQLRSGDLIVWYTDGLTEARDGAGNQYGMQRLIACMKQNSSMSAERLRDAILYDVRKFSAGQTQDDDITVVVAEYAPQA